jgi:carboxyl-terminal processing protease
LKKDSTEEKYFDNIKTEYDALSAKIMADKKDDLSKHKTEVKKYLEEEIVSRYYFQKGRIAFSLKNDDDLAEATRLLSDANKMLLLLSTSEKATKPFNLKKKF